MSHKQLDTYKNLIPDLDDTKCTVLSSVFDKAILSKINEIRKNTKEKGEHWAIPTGNLWVKGADAAKQWCTDNNLEYVEIANMTYEQAMHTLAKAKGLCFLPSGADTCPRLVIEAKLLGCDLQLNENVQHAEEEWFTTNNLDEMTAYLESVPKRFWDKVGVDEQYDTDAVGG